MGKFGISLTENNVGIMVMIISTVGLAVSSVLCNVAETFTDGITLTFYATSIGRFFMALLHDTTFAIRSYYNSKTPGDNPSIMDHMVLFNMLNPKQKEIFKEIDDGIPLLFISLMAGGLYQLFAISSMSLVNDVGDALAIMNCNLLIVAFLSYLFKYTKQDWKQRYWFCLLLVIGGVILVSSPSFATHGVDISECFGYIFAILATFATSMNTMAQTLYKKVKMEYIDTLYQSLTLKYATVNTQGQVITYKVKSKEVITESTSNVTGTGTGGGTDNDDINYNTGIIKPSSPIAGGSSSTASPRYWGHIKNPASFASIKSIDESLSISDVSLEAKENSNFVFTSNFKENAPEMSEKKSLFGSRHSSSGVSMSYGSIDISNDLGKQTIINPNYFSDKLMHIGNYSTDVVLTEDKSINKFEEEALVNSSYKISEELDQSIKNFIALRDDKVSIALMYLYVIWTAILCIIVWLLSLAIDELNCQLFNVSGWSSVDVWYVVAIAVSNYFGNYLYHYGALLVSNATLTSILQGVSVALAYLLAYAISFETPAYLSIIGSLLIVGALLLSVAPIKCKMIRNF